jgi:hypothetical protein
MTIESKYLAALELTHQMLAAANAQEWDTLTRLEAERCTVVAAIATSTRPLPSLEPALSHRIAEHIAQIERESGEIVEQVQAWQKHVRILLRLDKSTVA